MERLFKLLWRQAKLLASFQDPTFDRQRPFPLRGLGRQMGMNHRRERLDEEGACI